MNLYTKEKQSQRHRNQTWLPKGRGGEGQIKTMESIDTDGETVETVSDFIFLVSRITADGDCSHEMIRLRASWKKSYDKPRHRIKKQTYHFAKKGLSSQSYSFSSNHIWM